MFFYSLARLILILTATLCLCDCTKITDSHLSVNPKLNSPFTMPAEAYLALAANQSGLEQQALFIMAAGRLIYQGQWRQGLQVLDKTAGLSTVLSDEKTILLGKVALIREHPQLALRQFSLVKDASQLPLYYQVQYHEMLAHAYQSVGNPTDAVIERIKLGHLLPDNESKANNFRVLWLNLTALPTAELNTLSLEAPNDSELTGWMQLAFISRQHLENPDGILARVESWKAQHPTHPGQFILPTPLATVKPHLFEAPKRIALLLPLSGSLAGPGSAIRDGFMAAYDANPLKASIRIQLYDTANPNANIAAIYQQAINEGANYIVGPLTKPDVATVAGMAHPVPTLLLNDLEVKTTDNAYQFGLSPANEARQVAVKMRKNGYARALVIAPAGAWGDEIATAFSNQWRAIGGQLVDALHYTPQDDFNRTIRELLHVSESDARGKKIKQLLGQHIQLTASRRQDFDVIFLLSYPTKARQIVPLLRYYFAGDIPVYSTSAIYGGSTNVMSDRDLNGVTFADMPWVFSHQMGNKHWPETFNSYNRLYALGMDSYALSTQLNQLLLFPAMGVNDNSGVLYLNPNQHIARILAWGQFKAGVAEKIGG